MRAEDRRRAEGRIAGRALGAGLWVSGALMVLGLLLASWRPAPAPAGPPDWPRIARAAAGGNGAALTLLGILALIATPYLRVLLLAGAFAKGRQWRMLAVSLAVLSLLLAGILLGGTR